MAAEGTEREAATGPEIQVVQFRLGDEAFAADVGDVDSIVDLESFTRVPRAPEAVDGVMDLRGDIVAVVDPRVHLAVEADHEDVQEVLILDRPAESQRVGLRVDDVLGVEGVPESDIDLASDLGEIGGEGIEKGLVRGVIRDGDDLVSWVDVGKLLAETRPEAATAAAGGAEQ